jgi:hypothetical protein
MKSMLLFLGQPNRVLTGHQFISLYRQEVSIDFLLRFFHPLFLMQRQELYNPKRDRGSGNIGATNVGEYSEGL